MDKFNVQAIEDWYIKWLFKKMEEIKSGDSVLRETAVGTSGNLQDMFNHFCQLLIEVATLVSSRKDLGIPEISSMVQWPRNGEENTHGISQFIFIGLGLVTLLFDPKTVPTGGSLELNRNGYRQSSKNETWRAVQHSLEDVSGSISDLLRSFGGVKGCIPRCSSKPNSGNGLDTIYGLNLCFYTLTKLVDINILWVDDMCSHLEFDWKRKILKLFRFPSFCALIALGNEDSNFLSRFVQF